MSREKLSDSPLKKVVWQAVIDGPLMSYTSSQQYHNDRKDPAEINYSFPLPYGKVLFQSSGPTSMVWFVRQGLSEERSRTKV